MQEVLLSGKRLLSRSFKNMLDFHVHPQITLCGKNVSSEMDGEREGWLQITIYNILSTLVHIVPIYLEAASFSKYE